MSSELMKRQFAAQLKKCLELRYGGRLPSISKIARDFSFKANHLPHVSGETVRKWLRAESIPQYPRVQSLSDWLGPELLLPFENRQQNYSPPYNVPSDINKSTIKTDVTITADEITRFMILTQKLGREEFNLIFQLAEKFYSARNLTEC